MLDDITFRTAVPEDYDAIVTVMDDWWGRSVRYILPRLFLDHFHPTSTIATDADGLAGFLVGFASPARPDESYVHAVGVAPRRRGDGLGRELYRRFLTASDADGRPVVRAVTSTVNERSQAFHARLGFTVSGDVPDYDGPGADHVTFRIDLADPGPAAG